jgi:hypothetical protein
MILKGKLFHMIYHEVHYAAESEQKPSILEYTEIAYVVDFPDQRLRRFCDGKWTTIPFLPDETLQALGQLKLIGSWKNPNS